MGRLQCPICYSPLEVREVTPCFVCGGWPEVVARFDPTDSFTEYLLPSGQRLVLCRACQLEDFMVPGGWGARLVPGERLPTNGLRWVQAVQEPQRGRDKFCPVCNVRLAFAEVLADTQGHTEPRTATDRNLTSE